jgi:hypothetical protein
MDSSTMNGLDPTPAGSLGNAKCDETIVSVAQHYEMRDEKNGGENAGHNLQHAAVLRTLRRLGVAGGSKAPPSFAAKTRVKFKPHWKRDNLSVVVFVQVKNRRRVLGAAATKIAK